MPNGPAIGAAIGGSTRMERSVLNMLRKGGTDHVEGNRQPGDDDSNVP